MSDERIEGPVIGWVAADILSDGDVRVVHGHGVMSRADAEDMLWEEWMSRRPDDDAPVLLALVQPDSPPEGA